MRVVNINMVRDVSDVTELWFRHHKDIFDHFYIVDNNSSDATPKIIEKLKAEGFPITLTSDTDMFYSEAPIVSKILWANADKADWFLFIDVDEFLSVDKTTLINNLMAVKPQYIPKLKWRTWVPSRIDFQQSLSNFKPMKAEHGIYKVAVDRRRAPYSKLDMGTHDVSNRITNDDKKISSYYSGLIINHFPIRSPQQALSKIILFNHIFELRKIIYPGIKTISQDIYKQIKEADFQMDLPMMQSIASRYNLNGNFEVADEAFSTTATVQYPELAKIDLTASLAKQLELHSQYVRVFSK